MRSEAESPEPTDTEILEWIDQHLEILHCRGHSWEMRVWHGSNIDVEYVGTLRETIKSAMRHYPSISVTPAQR